MWLSKVTKKMKILVRKIYSNLLKFTQFTQLTVAYYISAQPIVLDRYVRCMSE